MSNNSVYVANQEIFERIPGNPIAYWVSEKFSNLFTIESIVDKYALKVCKGGFTGRNDFYLRYWFEVDINKIPSKWNRYSKGGSYRRWYGNSLFVILWEGDGSKLKREPKAGVGASKYYGKEHFVWSGISTGLASFRYDPKEIFFDDVSPAVVFSGEPKYEILGLLNSKVVIEMLKFIAPTMHFQAGDIKMIPVHQGIFGAGIEIIKDNIKIAKEDWDSFEISWDFEKHPLLSVIQNNRRLFDKNDDITIEECFSFWELECRDRFNQLKKNEEELNNTYIDIYGLHDELTSEVDDKDISVHMADFGRDIRSLISYAVGCMFGRYSLDGDGLIFAGGEFDKLKYKTFSPDTDAIIPITDEQYFDDDIVGRFEDFIKVVFGSKSLETNLEYIAEALGTKGNSSRDKIRTYFLNDFYKDHCNTYSVAGSGKRPIYWLFDSGKQNGFKCLIYLHRYTPDTVGLIRSDYLTKAQSMIENALKNAEYAISTSGSAVDRAQATKKRDKYIKQLAEIRAYYPALSHIALQRINLDLDDGVKVNYAKFQGIEVTEDGGKRQTIDLLAKI